MMKYQKNFTFFARFPIKSRFYLPNCLCRERPGDQYLPQMMIFPWPDNTEMFKQYVCTHDVTDLGPDHGGHQLPRVHVDHGERQRDVELPDHGEADCPPGVGVDRDKHAGDAGESSYHHRAEQDPPPTPLIHKVPPDEI